MFGKFMNNYYYGKSGKGDYNKEDLPTTRWQLFWEMLRVRLSGLCRLNLMYLVAWLPTMLVLMFGITGILTGLMGEDGELVANADVLLMGMVQTTLLLLIPCFTITGIATPGVAYVTRNWSRDEHAFIWSDFKDAVKLNWKQGVLTALITGILPLAVWVGWDFYGEMAATTSFWMIVPQVLVLMVGILWSLAVTYMHPLIVSYQLKFKDVLRNAFLLAIARLPMSVGIRLLHCVPMVIALLLALVVNPLYCVMGLFFYYALIGFALSRFITASFTNAVFDKYINSQIEGAVVNRGLNTEVEDDDFDDEEEEQE
ncbi:MAG: YesL family protein [Clostridia bacterium]|nr:YesL family protein [Clostridia bacterium]